MLTSTASLVLPLAAFLTAAIWLAQFAERAGLAGRAATALTRAAGGRRGQLYALACLLCCGLTAAVSLDGAVTLMVPLVLALAPELRRALLLATVGAANASSLAVPQGNPTNLIVMRELGLGPAEFTRRLLLPALAATLLCVAAVAWRERAALRGHLRVPQAVARTPLTKAERVAVAAVLVAGLAGVALPWLGVAPWWALCGAALLCFATARALRLPTPPLAVPWRVIGQVGALVLAFEAVKGHLHVAPPGSSAAALVALALGAGLLAAAVNNLPASVALGGLLGAATLPAFAALAGLSVGALATPHGSAATLIAFHRAGERPRRRCYVKLWLPTAAAATTAAALLIAR